MYPNLPVPFPNSKFQKNYPTTLDLGTKIRKYTSLFFSWILVSFRCSVVDCRCWGSVDVVSVWERLVMLGSALSGSAGFVDGLASVAFGSDFAMMCESGCGFWFTVIWWLWIWLRGSTGLWPCEFSICLLVLCYEFRPPFWLCVQVVFIVTGLG